jgi:polar amino acid transport system permease protein
VQGTPLLILMFLTYFGLSIIGLSLPAWWPPACR